MTQSSTLRVYALSPLRMLDAGSAAGRSLIRIPDTADRVPVGRRYCDAIQACQSAMRSPGGMTVSTSVTNGVEPSVVSRAR